MILSVFHAFSGCYYIASFKRRGKIRPLKLLDKDEIVQQVFSKLNEWDVITEEDMRLVEGYVWAMYEKNRLRSVDELRLELFLTK